MGDSRKLTTTHEFQVAGDAEHVTQSVGNIAVDANTPLEEIMALRRKQIEAIMKQGGVSVETVITGTNVKSVTTGAYNLTIGSQPENKSSLNIIDDGGPFLTIKIPLKGKEDTLIIIEKTPGKKNDIKTTHQAYNFYTSYSIEWDGIKEHHSIEKPGIYRLNAGNFRSNWKSDEKIAAEQAAASALSAQPSTSVSSSKVSSTFSSSTSTSQYASSSSAVFKAESKQPNSTATTKPPTAKKLNDILGIPDLVIAVEDLEKGYTSRILISFNPKINPSSYEHIINEKLLGGISNVTLTNIGNGPLLRIPADAKIYEQFMQNIASANKPVAQLRVVPG